MSTPPIWGLSKLFFSVGLRIGKKRGSAGRCRKTIPKPPLRRVFAVASDCAAVYAADVVFAFVIDYDIDFVFVFDSVFVFVIVDFC